MSAQQEQANVQPEDISLEEDDTFEEFEVEGPWLPGTVVVLCGWVSLMGPFTFRT